MRAYKVKSKKKKKKWAGLLRPTAYGDRETTFKLSDFLVNTPVTGQTGPVNRTNRSVYRSEPVTHVLLNLDLNSTGFRSNRSGKLLSEGGGLTGPVGFVNPGDARHKHVSGRVRCV